MSKITVKELPAGYTVIFEGAVYGKGLTEQEAQEVIDDITTFHPDAEEEWVE